TRSKRDWSSDVCSSDLIGHARVTVHRRPNVAVLSTGDELVDLTEQPAPGKIRDTNRYSISAAVRATGSAAFELGIAGDDASDLQIGRASCRERVESAGV